MASPYSFVDVSNAVQAMMVHLGINGRYDVRYEGSRSTGWIGKPTGTDYEVVVTLNKLPQMKADG